MPETGASRAGQGGLRGFLSTLRVWLTPQGLRPRQPSANAPRAEHPHPPSIAIAGSQPQWLRVLGADALLQIVQADKPIAHIWRVSRLSRPVFERDCLAALRRYAEFVQLLPASESHHHAHAGGLLAHTVETLLAAMTWRNGRLLPEGAPIEEIDAQRDEWTLVVFYAALLHDIGKVLADLRVAWRARNLEAVRWMPLAGSLIELAQGRALAEYLVEFTARVERDYSAHSRAAVLLLQRIASGESLALLARTPRAFEALNQYLSGQDKDSLLAQIVRQADKASVQRSLANGSRARFATARAVPLVDLLMQALKSMLREGGELPLNRSGAAGWVHQGSLWLVAKRMADATRAWINKHEPGEAVPGETKNDRLFDTWQEYGCILPNPATGQAIWYVTVQGQAPAKTEAGDGQDQELKQGAYVHNLAMLRFRLDKLFDDPEQYPAPMSGTITVLEKRTANSPEAEAGDEREAVAAQETPKTEAGSVSGAAVPPKAEAVLPKSVKTASGSARDTGRDPEQDDAEAGRSGGGGKSRPDHPGKPPRSSVPNILDTNPIKAPTFNKPKPKPAPEVAPQAVDPAPKPAIAERVDTLVAAPIQPVQKDNDAGLLNEQDMAPPDEPRRNREQRMLAKAAKQAQAPKPAPTPQPASATPSVIARKLLAQPVGGPRRLLLDTAPIETARTAMTQLAESPNPALGPVHPNN